MSHSLGITAQQHILLQQKERFPDASGEFSWLLSGITLACKIISAAVRRAGLVDVLGATGEMNVQGERVQKLDHYANAALMHCLGNRGNVGVIASEENEHPEIVLRDAAHGKYVVVFDPLDGSSNIDCNISTGTIFSILRRDPGTEHPTGCAPARLQADRRWLCPLQHIDNPCVHHRRRGKWIHA